MSRIFLLCSAFAFIVLPLDVEASDELICYQCGTDINNHEIETCKFFIDSSRWGPFEVPCPSDSVCVKMQPPLQGNVSRSCQPKKNSMKKELHIGCSNYNFEGEVGTICVCDTNRCNSALSLTPNFVNSLILVICLVIYK